MIAEYNYTLEKLKKAGDDYQQFELDEESQLLRPSGKHKTKHDLLNPFMEKLDGLDVLEIGCDKGLYTYMACKAGASSIVANDIRLDLVDYRNLMFRILDMPVTNTSENLFEDMTQEPKQYDYVMALAVLHQIKNGNMEGRIAHIQKMSRFGTLLEFCEDYQEKLGPTWNLSRFKRIVGWYYKNVSLVAQYPAVGDYKGVRYVYDCRCH
jgi:2-polyprenyl-3-methyl-5-hydroxy-6-metoxy-1,4-benzoquinol methylase